MVWALKNPSGMSETRNRHRGGVLDEMTSMNLQGILHKLIEVGIHVV